MSTKKGTCLSKNSGNNSKRLNSSIGGPGLASIKGKSLLKYGEAVSIWIRS